jgi:hypothetical protein
LHESTFNLPLSLRKRKTLAAEMCGLFASLGISGNCAAAMGTPWDHPSHGAAIAPSLRLTISAGRSGGRYGRISLQTGISDANLSLCEENSNENDADGDHSGHAGAADQRRGLGD